jgi:hypothetical protein
VTGRRFSLAGEEILAVGDVGFKLESPKGPTDTVEELGGSALVSRATATMRAITPPAAARYLRDIRSPPMCEVQASDVVSRRF